MFPSLFGTTVASFRRDMFRPKTRNRFRIVTDWCDKIGEPAWRVYSSVIDAAQENGITFALGGGFAVSTYTGNWRDTKDLDLYVLPRHRERMIDLLGFLGLVDYFDQRAYDRSWIYRATAGSVIVDTIWALANGRAEVDEAWMSGPEVEISGRRLKVIPPEVMLWDKLYIMQRERCDWPDVLNLLYTTGPGLDWNFILERLGGDADLLAGALSVFRWISPGIADNNCPQVSGNEWVCLRPEGVVCRKSERNMSPGWTGVPGTPPPGRKWRLDGESMLIGAMNHPQP